MTLTEFLLARIAEDEAAARKVTAPMPMSGIKPVSVSFGKVVGLMIDPARVLAECEAKRRIVRLHHDNNEDDDGWPDGCATCGMVGEYTVPWPCETVRALAQPHAEHPDFDPSWRL